MRAAILGLGLLLTASVALAQGADVVRLANGGRLRGTVEIYEPGRDVVILLPDGTRRTIPSAEVAEVIFGDDASAPTPVAPPVEPVPEPGPIAAEPTPPIPPMTPVTPVTPPLVLVPVEPVSPTRPPSSAEPRTPRASPDDDGALPGVQHLGAVESIAGVPEGAARVYQPAAELSDAPWLDDPGRAEIPEGILHLGVEVRGTYRFPAYGVTDIGGAEVSGVLDLRPVSRFHLRAAFLLGFTNYEFRAGSSPVNAYQSGTGAVQLAGRFLLGFDIARFFQLRVGGEIGGDYVPAVNLFQVYGGPQIEAAGLVTDDGRLEMGLSFGVPLHPSCSTELYVGADQFTRCGLSFYPRLQLLVGYHFL